MDTTESRVKTVISAQLGVVEAALLPESTFADHGADSLDQVEMVMALEDEFDLEISDEDAFELKTVQQAVDYITKRVDCMTKRLD